MCIRINDTCQGINTVFEQSEALHPEKPRGPAGEHLDLVTVP